MKKYNFNAGPSMLPREVIENTAKQILNFNDSGLSLMEISHRAKDFQPVIEGVDACLHWVVRHAFIGTCLCFYAYNTK